MAGGIIYYVRLRNPHTGSIYEPTGLADDYESAEKAIDAAEDYVKQRCPLADVIVVKRRVGCEVGQIIHNCYNAARPGETYPRPIRRVVGGYYNGWLMRDVDPTQDY